MLCEGNTVRPGGRPIISAREIPQFSALDVDADLVLCALIIVVSVADFLKQDLIQWPIVAIEGVSPHSTQY